MPLLVEAAGLDGVRIEASQLDWGGDRLIREGAAMPEDWEATLRRHDAVFLGAVGHRDVPAHVSVWTLVLPIRKALNLYVNVRPVRPLPGIPTPFNDATSVDFVVVRENTEGEYTGSGGRVHTGPEEVAIDIAVHSRKAIERVARYGHAQERGDLLSLVTKSNVSRYGYALWDEVVAELGATAYREVPFELVYVDAMAARMVERPDSLGVLLCSNLFGDILSDLGATFQGGLGLAPSANIAPGSDGPWMYEPVHGSAPDIAGRGVANPGGAILSAAMLLRDIGCANGASALERALKHALAEGGARTPDIGGGATTVEAAASVREALQLVADAETITSMPGADTLS
jgi:tartrate dehydrogenase/decarboxylase/D-malate dehydrogenase